MAIDSRHWAWQRERPQYHGGAVRSYAKDPDDDGFPRGPDATPRMCVTCKESLEYDSLSPGSTSWYLSSSAESSPDLNHNFPVKSLRLVNNSRFDMKGKLHWLGDCLTSVITAAGIYNSRTAYTLLSLLV